VTVRKATATLAVATVAPAGTVAAFALETPPTPMVTPDRPVRIRAPLRVVLAAPKVDRNDCVESFRCPEWMRHSG